MAVKPQEIIDRQLELLKVQSDKGALTFEECQSLERLIRMQILMKLKSGNGLDDDESLQGLTSEELKSLLPLLTK